MGNFWNKLFNLNKQFRILMLGLDASGKTTVLYNLKLGSVGQTIPTIGFNVEDVEYKNIKFTMWDIGGQHKIRPLWKYYFKGTQALIFVVDSNDIERMEEACEELKILLKEDLLRGVPLLVLSNKQDMPSAMSIEQINNELGLYSIRDRKWYNQPTIATKGEGLAEGIEWLCEQLLSSK